MDALVNLQQETANQQRQLQAEERELTRQLQGAAFAELETRAQAVTAQVRSAQEIAKSVDVSGRPLLKDDREKIFRLQKEREKLYRKYADAVYSGGTPAELADTIQLMFEMTE